MLRVDKKTIHAEHHEREIFNQTKSGVHVSLFPPLETYLQSKRIEHLFQKNIKRLRDLLKELDYSSMKISRVSSSAFIPSRNELIVRPVAFIAFDTFSKLKVPPTFTILFYCYAFVVYVLVILYY